MVGQYALRYTKDGAAEAIKMSGSMPLEQGFALAEHFYNTGPRGLEFVRYAIETHVIRNYYFVKQNYPESSRHWCRTMYIPYWKHMAWSRKKYQQAVEKHPSAVVALPPFSPLARERSTQGSSAIGKERNAASGCF